MKKNVAGQVVGAEMVSATDGSAFTGSVTARVTGDGGTQATGSVGSGACTHEGNGFHTYTPAQAETNYDHIAFTFTGTGAVPVTVQVYPSFPQTGDNFSLVSAIKAKTDQLTFTATNKLDATIQAAGDFAQAAADKVWSSTTRSLSAAGVQAIWDALTSALTTVGSIGKLIADNLNATVSSRATPAQVNDEVLDVLAVDTFAEPSSVPAATSTLKDKINWLFALARNKVTQTSTTQTLRNAADSASVATSTLSDDGSTLTRGEWS